MSLLSGARWWPWNVTSHGGGGACTPQGQSACLSLCEPPPSSGDWVKTSKGRLPTGYRFPCFSSKTLSSDPHADELQALWQLGRCDFVFHLANLLE